MQSENDFTHNTIPQDSTPIPVWNDFRHYHDFMITLLSCNRKHNVTINNIWDDHYE